VQAHLRLDRAVRVADVELVGHRVGRHGHALLVDRDPAVAVVAHEADERRHVAEVVHGLLVALARVNGTAEAPSAVVYCTPSSRKP
jgi:hypothetical protein